jgi:hypothetical protein
MKTHIIIKHNGTINELLKVVTGAVNQALLELNVLGNTEAIEQSLDSACITAAQRLGATFTKDNEDNLVFEF